MTDECAIDPRSFARTLRDQRRTRMKGGLYHLNQVLMAYNSNRIEGSRLDEKFVPVNDERRSREGVFEFGLRTVCADAMCALTEKLNVLSDGSAEVLTKEVVKIFTAH